MNFNNLDLSGLPVRVEAQGLHRLLDSPGAEGSTPSYFPLLMDVEIRSYFELVSSSALSELRLDLEDIDFNFYVDLFVSILYAAFIQFHYNYNNHYNSNNHPYNH